MRVILFYLNILLLQMFTPLKERWTFSVPTGRPRIWFSDGSAKQNFFVSWLISCKETDRHSVVHHLNQFDYISKRCKAKCTYIFSTVWMLDNFYSRWLQCRPVCLQDWVDIWLWDPEEWQAASALSQSLARGTTAQWQQAQKVPPAPGQSAGQRSSH